MILILVGENFIYQSDIFPGSFAPARYGLVSEMGLLVTLLGLSLLCIRALIETRPHRSYSLLTLSGVFLTAVLVYSVFQFEAAASTHPEQSRAAKEGSGYSQGVLKAAAAELAKSQPGQLVMLPGSPLDYELLLALPVFIELYSPSEVSFFIRPAYGPDATDDPIWQNIMKRIDFISENGLRDNSWRISPLRDLDQNSPLVCFWFVEELSSDQCSATFGLK
jgi:hypothetical protein